MKPYRLLLFILPILAACETPAPSEPLYYELSSPDGALNLKVGIDSTVRFELYDGDELLVTVPSPSMLLSDGTVFGVEHGGMLPLKDVKVKKYDKSVQTPFHRNSTVRERYFQTDFIFKGYGMRIRLYEDGFAYRFFTFRKGDYSVAGENAEFVFSGDPMVYAAYSNAPRGMEYQCSFENIYHKGPLSSIRRDTAIMTPLLVRRDNGMNLLVSDCDIISYPGMFLKSDGTSLKGAFAHIPDRVDTIPPRGQVIPVSYSDVIAHCNGKRQFPWRVIGYGNDKQLISSDLMYLLGSTSKYTKRMARTIVPGQAAWEWWNDWGITADGFEPGVNNATYRKYIDFASKFGLEYVVIDEGWSPQGANDMFATVPQIDIDSLVSYGNDKGVGVILWCVGYVLDRQLEEAFRHYSAMGVKGFKVDFIDRDDQKAVDMVHRICSEAARHSMIVDLHGMYKPSGLNRTYPNVLNFEGVWGMEQMKWSSGDMVSYDLEFPFIRMWAGPVDYTQGAMKNLSREDFVPDYSNPSSQGTRARQVAEYVIFDSPLVMLCDSPDRYMADPVCTQFISSIPPSADRIVPVDALLGSHIVTARQAADRWFVGGINGWQTMKYGLDFGKFLPEGQKFRCEMLRDADKDGKSPEKYIIDTFIATASTIREIDLAPGGGFAVRMTPVKE